MPVDKILVQIKNVHHLKWSRLLHSSLDVQDKKKYCFFHKDHGHYIEDCRDLKEQLKELIRKGKLQKVVKKGESSQPRDEYREKSETPPPFNRQRQVIQPTTEHDLGDKNDRWETIGGSFKSLKKS